MKLTEIQDLIKFVARSGVTEVEIEQSNFKITIKSNPALKKGAKNQPETQIQQQMPMAMPQMMMPQAAQVMPQAAQAPPQPAPAPAAEQPKKEERDDSKYVVVKSPMIGTFYRAPGPDKDPFVSVGDDIKPGKVICIIEAMKLFNEIEAEISGKIVKVLADEATPVEYDQPLFLVDPS
jgi:acetyl-CoA carboxylase biotin carboxyl carrier protein